ncbi:moronecidin [Nematolebias whitei]|uniref:moronecidin n=1 Tax=Nematolebias whitei TaxID=451745 RepID=UPI00189B7519|nr:moronecidin [Nematolebias whitei]XP_037541871.1 moronecidin [Nematolebias whitei]
MKCAVMFLVLSMVVLMAQPGEGFWHVLAGAATHLASHFLNNRGETAEEQADQQQLNQQLAQEEAQKLDLQRMNQQQLDEQQQQLDEQQQQDQEQLNRRSFKSKFARRHFN